MWLRLFVVIVVVQVLTANRHHGKHRGSEESDSDSRSKEWHRGEGSSEEGKGGSSSSESSEEGRMGRHHGGRRGHHFKKACKKHGFHHFFKHHRRSGSGSGSFEGFGRHGGWSRSREESGSREWRHHKRCPDWGPWQQSKCLWPTMDYSSIPDACKAHPKDDKIPQTIIDFKTAKAKEIYEVVQTLFKNRGATKPCGYCSRKVQCRNREEEGHLKHGCQFKQFKMVNEECDGIDVCQLSPVMGGCPAPVPQRHLMMMKMRMDHHFQHGHFHHYAKHWGHHFGGGRGPRSSAVSDESSSSKSNETSSSSSTEHKKGDKKHEKGAKSGEHEEHGGWGHHRNHTEIPLWNCVKSKDGSKCLCCCGSYFPDVASGKCQKIKWHHKMPPFDLWDLTSGGMATGGKTE